MRGLGGELLECNGEADHVHISRSPHPAPEPGVLIEPKVEALIKATGIDFRIGGKGAARHAEILVCGKRRRLRLWQIEQAGQRIALAVRLKNRLAFSIFSLKAVMSASSFAARCRLSLLSLSLLRRRQQ